MVRGIKAAFLDDKLMRMASNNIPLVVELFEADGADGSFKSMMLHVRDNSFMVYNSKSMDPIYSGDDPTAAMNAYNETQPLELK